MSITPNPEANYTPPMKGYSGQGAFRFWCQTVLPIVYDDSLSYYELLNKIVIYLNNTIADVAAMEDNVQALHDAYAQLESYVNHYFDELDVQSAINAKLDSMASSGELDTLLEPFVTAQLPDVVDAKIDGVVAEQIDGSVAGQIDSVVASQIAEPTATAVTSWLGAHVDPVGSAVVVDNTLTITGAAADAKATGDEISDLNTHLTAQLSKNVWDVDLFENGAISASTGANANSTTRIRSIGYMPLNIAKYHSTNADMRFMLYAYNADDTYAGGWKNGAFDPTDAVAYAEIDMQPIYNTVAYKNYKYRAVILINDGTARVENITGVILDSLFYTTVDKTLAIANCAADAKATGDEIDDLSDRINARLNKNLWDVTWFEDGSISATTGENANNSSRIRSIGYMPLYISRYHSTNINMRFMLYAYNANDTYAGGWKNGAFDPTDAGAYAEIDMQAIYNTAAYANYKYRVVILINGGTARVENITDVILDNLLYTVVDRTLAVDYCAADAKVTGDAINNSLQLALTRCTKIPNNTDFNTLTTAGNYYVENYSQMSGHTNTPPGIAAGGRLFVEYGISSSRPVQIWLSFNSSQEPELWMRVYTGSAWGKWNKIESQMPVNLRVLGYNIGKFNYGFDHSDPHVADIDEKIVNYKKHFGNLNPDIMLFAELTEYIDTSDTINTDTRLLYPLFKSRVNFNGCAADTNLPNATTLETDGGVYLRNDSQEYSGTVGRLVCDIGNKKLIMSGGFLRVLGTAQDRAEAFENYLGSIDSYDYSIIYLDTNVYDVTELANIKSIATTAGYTCCNWNYFGTLDTLVPTSVYKPIDNIFVKGNIKVKNFFVASDDDYDELSSDHRYIVADLTLY